MAIAGDVLIKLAADFAEFTRGIDQSKKELKDFGDRAAATGERIEHMVNQARRAAEALGVIWVAHKVLEYGAAIEATASQVVTLSKNLELTTDQIQALQAAALRGGIAQETMTGAVSRFNAMIGQAVLHNTSAIDTFDKLGIKILDANNNVRPTADLLQEAAQKLLAIKDPATRAALEIEVFGKAGKDVNALLPDWARGVATLQQQYAKQIMPPETIEKLEAFKNRSEEARREIEVRVAPWWEFIKTNVLELVDKLLKSIGDSLTVINSNVGAFDKIRNIANLFSFGAAGAIAGPNAAMDDAQRRILALGLQFDQATKDLNEAQQHFAEAQKRGFDTTIYQQDIDTYKAKLADLRKEIEAQSKLVDQLGKGGLPVLPPTIVTGGANQPTHTPTGGGSGHSQADEIERQIKRYELLGQAAQHAMDTIERSRNVPIEDLQRNVRVQQQIDDIIAKQGSRTGITDEQKKRLEAAVDASERLRDAVQKRLQAETQADETERRLGDGTEALARAQRDLTKQKETDRLGTVAYTRALKQQEEAIANAADEAARYDDNLGSLTAGFDQAARRYARAHDLFSVGQQAFSGFVDLLDEGLDALAGRSRRTFGQIAGDFALMLAKMAAQAAASSIFKSIFGALSGGAAYVPASTGVSFPDIGSLINNLGQGTARAGGGDVYPGNVYRVGEYGPERFVPAVAGSIQPAARSMGDVSVSVDMSGGQQRTDPRQAAEMARKLRTAVVDVITNEKRPGGLLYT